MKPLKLFTKEVTCCAECPNNYCGWCTSKWNSSTRQEAYIKKVLEIPEWCPLEDAKEEEKNVKK